jgi:hypothetical protein
MDSFMAFLKHSRPQSVLDISIGNAKMGFVARDALLFSNGNKTAVTESTIKIDGIAGDPSHIRAHHRTLYDQIHMGDPETVIDQLGIYDMVVVDGVLDRMDKSTGEALLLKCMQHCSRFVAVFLPLANGGPQESDGRRDGWQKEDLLPMSKMHRLRHIGDSVRGAFLLSKETFIDHYIDQLKNIPFQSATPAPDVIDIRQSYHLDRDHVGRIDLKRFDKHVVNPEHRNYFFDTDFREHYRLIAHLSSFFQGSTIFDIGTNKGYSSLALSHNPDNSVVSYDLVECKELGFPEELTNIEYRLGDVRQDSRLLSSPLIMLDTNHDGEFEHEFYDFLRANRYKGLLFLDDIHLNEPMKAFWQHIREPKEDVTDLGHWSGSGLVVFP